MKTNFKIGDIIYFINNNEVKKEKITGIAIYQGDIKSLYNEKNVKKGDYLVEYHCGPYVTVTEDKAYKTSDELKLSIFDKVK